MAVIAIAVANRPESGTMELSLQEDGSLLIPVSEMKEAFQYVDYGETQQILVWREENGEIHTAFNTCQECFPRGNARYIYQHGILTCQSCGNQIPVETMGASSWGGCQPVAIPAEYRGDTDTEIRIPESLLDYSREMFETWENGDFSVTMAEYVP